ncbi:hypothetical protein JW851_02935 [Candidatus Woesearchaeota archaeon]|nr:hypothetical protein [Candidatus Woesearchaeota archaeon]
MNPKILVGCPASDHKSYCLREYAEAVKKLNYDNFDILLVDNSKGNDYLYKLNQFGLNAIKGPWFDKARDRIICSRNILKEYALKNSYDFLFSLEQDVIPEPNTLQRLFRHNLKIVSGVVKNNLKHNNETKLLPMVYVAHKLDPTGLDYINEEELKKPRLIEIKGCGLGCVLIHKDVLKKISFRYSGGFDDMMFCKDVIENGFRIFLDTEVQPRHLHSSWRGIEK